MNNTPSAWSIGQMTGQNVYSGIQKAQDRSAIDQILSQAANDPAKLQQSMTQILSQVSPERQEMALNVLQSRYQQLEKAQQLQRQTNQSAILSRALSGEASPEEMAQLPTEVQVKLRDQEIKLRDQDMRLRGQQAKNQGANKPGIKETAELKNLGKTSKNIDSRLADLKRARELIPQTSTGPIRGIIADRTWLSNEQQELQGIANRLLTGSFDVLPRIISEFESFKQGQLSLHNPPEVNMRIIDQMQKAADMEKRVIDRIDELQSMEGLSEIEAYRQAKEEFKAEGANLLSNLKDAQRPKTKEEIDAILFGG